MFGSEVVDILCVGSGSAGLAAAIAAADHGLKVLVAEPRRSSASGTQPSDMPESWTEVLRRRWCAEEFNTPTETYLDELTRCLGPPSRPIAKPYLPVNAVENFDDVDDVDPTAAVAPFHGAEMAKWARDCLMSPYSMMLSRVSPSMMTEVRLQDGSTIRAGLVAPVPRQRRSGATVRQWLGDLAADSGVEVQHSSTVRRLIFNDGHLVGALLDMPDGLRHVRARSGVLLGSSCSRWDDELAMRPMPTDNDTRLCVVSRTASRFARLELLTCAQSLSVAAAPGRLPEHRGQRLTTAARPG